MKTKMVVISVIAMWVVGALTACGHGKHKGDRHRGHNGHHHQCMDKNGQCMHKKMKAKQAQAVLQPQSGAKLSGSVNFEQVSRDVVAVTAKIEGLKPGSQHGFHIHEFGDCSDNGKGAGDHYNPMNVAHGAPNADVRHAGDLGNVKADKSGVVELQAKYEDISVQGRKNPILGRAVILHADADDLKSQPSGNAGKRIACGVIGVVKK